MDKRNLLTCKKVKFVNDQESLKKLSFIQEKSKRKVIPVRAYLCKYCNKWHLTSRLDTFELQKENERLKSKILELQKELSRLNSRCRL